MKKQLPPKRAPGCVISHFLLCVSPPPKHRCRRMPVRVWSQCECPTSGLSGDGRRVGPDQPTEGDLACGGLGLGRPGTEPYLG